MILQTEWCKRVTKEMNSRDMRSQTMITLFNVKYTQTQFEEKKKQLLIHWFTSFFSSTSKEKKTFTFVSHSNELTQTAKPHAYLQSVDRCDFIFYLSMTKNTLKGKKCLHFFSLFFCCWSFSALSEQKKSCTHLMKCRINSLFYAFICSLFEWVNIIFDALCGSSRSYCSRFAHCWS